MRTRGSNRENSAIIGIIRNNNNKKWVRDALKGCRFDFTRLGDVFLAWKGRDFPGRVARY